MKLKTTNQATEVTEDTEGKAPDFCIFSVSSVAKEVFA